PFADLTETRVALERAAAAEAAKHRDPKAIQEAWSALELMEHTGDVDQFNEADTAFHMGIINAGANLLIRHLTSAIREAAEFPIKVAEASLASWVLLRDELVIEHRALLCAVEKGDADTAAALVEAHIRHAYAAFTA
ncbi:MAG: FadR/GntR family transcriptional regulator, partial [Propionibacteriaceae bacterium]